MKQIGDVLKDMGWNEKLRDLAQRVRRNVPDRHDPERFHGEKDEIARELEDMAGGHRK